MALLHTTLILCHIVTAAAWFGMALRLGAHARLVVSLQGEGALTAANDGVKAIRWMGVWILLTWLFSIGSLMLGGGYPGQYQYHTAAMLIFILVVVQYSLIRPAWNGLREAVVAGAERKPFGKRVAITTGIGHLLWFVLLLLMFWNRFAAAL